MTSSKRLGSRSAAKSWRPAPCAALVLGITLALASTLARAETQVGGTPQAATVEGQSGLEIGARLGNEIGGSTSGKRDLPNRGGK